MTEEKKWLESWITAVQVTSCSVSLMCPDTTVLENCRDTEELWEANPTRQANFLFPVTTWVHNVVLSTIKAATRTLNYVLRSICLFMSTLG